MKNFIATVFFVLIGSGAASTAVAQMTKDNTKMTCEARKLSGNKYELVLHVALEKGWHVFAFKAGGDGSLLSPEVSFEKNSKVTLEGKPIEKGKLISEKMEGIDGKVNIYENKVDYVQRATISGATTVTGNFMYQICSDKMCLPPTTKTFKVAVK